MNNNIIRRNTEINELARTMVGDGKAPNLFFVSAHGIVQTVTANFELAYAQWQAFAAGNRIECTLEDRKTGTIASVEPEDDDSKCLIRYDDSFTFGFCK